VLDNGKEEQQPRIEGVAHLDGSDHSSQQAPGSRRFLTVLFADLCDSSRLAVNVDAEVFAEVLRNLRELAREVVSRHGGHIARIQGDGVLAVFGYPDPTENEARRAAEAAIDLREAVESLRVEGVPHSSALFGLHAGIHAGLVFLIDGDIERGRFDLVGDIPNTAARMCSLAQDGEICVSESTLGPAAQFFIGEVHEVPIKGHDEPMLVRKITGRAPVRRMYEASVSKGLTHFVGRGEPWRRLRERWERTLAGAPGHALVTGPPGHGKTRLIEEFARACAADDAIVLRGFCERYLSAEPMQPFLQMLHAAAASGDESSVADPASVGLLLAAIRTPASATGGAQQVFAAIAGWIEGMAARHPVLLVLDDWQWADDASRQALDLILALGAPVFALVASRTANAAALGARGHDSIDLAPLTAAETRAVVNHWLPALDPFLVDEIHGYAGGIPLFVEELCHAVAAGGRLQPRVPSGGTVWLSALVESRVARLDANSASVLRVAAVLGSAFPVWLFERVTGCGAEDARLRVLAEQDLLYPADQPGLLRFKHGITRDAVYATVGLAERQRLHGKVAAILESAQGDGGETALEALAYHLGAAGEASRAAGHAEAAGDKAMAANALDRARAQYTAALRELDALPSLVSDDMTRWCRVAQKLGMACVFDPISIPDRERLLERAVALAEQLGNANLQARAEYWLGYTGYAAGRALAGLPHCERAIALAEASGDIRLVAQVRATLGQVLTAVARYEDALPMLDEAIAAKRRGATQGGNTAIGSAYALACKGLLLTDRGVFGPADSCFAESRALLGTSAHPVASSVCGLMSISLLWQGRWAEAIEIAGEGARIAENSRSRQLLAMGHSIAGYARWVWMKDANGLNAIREAMQWLETRAGRFMISLLYGWLMEGAVAEGDDAQVRRHAARLLLRAREADRIGEAMGCRAMAYLEMKRNHLDEAARWLARSDRSAAVRGSPHEAANNDVCRARLEMALGLAEHAHASLHRAHDAYRDLRMDWHLEDAQRAR